MILNIGYKEGLGIVFIYRCLVQILAIQPHSIIHLVPNITINNIMIERVEDFNFLGMC